MSRTVLRLSLTVAARTKLMSERALNADRQFVEELEALFSEHKSYHKDREALKQTVLACCDPLELQRVSPPHLKQLSSLSIESDAKAKRQAIGDLAGCLTATRNQVAHAKAGYAPTGEECPAEHLSELAECSRVAAQQAIRWYSSQHEDTR